MVLWRFFDVFFIPSNSIQQLVSMFLCQKNRLFHRKSAYSFTSTPSIIPNNSSSVPARSIATVIFAHGDFTIRRVLFRHLEIDSPFNTYRRTELPPRPIRIPSTTVIHATLSSEWHNYIFMAANADFSGRHSFAVTHAQHQRNAAAWHRALNERRIFR